MTEGTGTAAAADALAIMHGSSYRGDGAAALNALADSVDASLASFAAV
jgi:hypothetical protein